LDSWPQDDRPLSDTDRISDLQASAGEQGSSPEEANARLLIACPDRPGIVAAIAGFLSEAGTNIVQADQYSTDPWNGMFFARLEFSFPHASEGRADLEAAFAAVAEPLQARWRISHAADRKRIAILVSREEHCLLDLLWRWRGGELGGDVVLVVSNHPHHRSDVQSFGLPYHQLQIDPAGKSEAEERLLELLVGNVDVVILARYMQILSADFLQRLAVPVINIHHSFLPAFAGAEPYLQAKRRGVKLIGATAHYVTEQLDAGPIIEQDVIRVTHRQDIAGLARLGRDIERTVLARAVAWHCADRILIHEETTVVF
jgi:formyltetrahydrofolate deformylase